MTDGFSRSKFREAGMLGHEFLAGFRFATLNRGLRRARIRRASQTDGARETPTAASPGSSGTDEDHEGSAERARLLRKASVHGRVAIQIAELMQGNAAERDDLRQRLAGLPPPGKRPADGSAIGWTSASSALREQIEVLDRIIFWQLKTISWHRREDRRLRDQAGP
jgi:hypothetical protein